MYGRNCNNCNHSIPQAFRDKETNNKQPMYRRTKTPFENLQFIARRLTNA